jgi:holin-like protein
MKFVTLFTALESTPSLTSQSSRRTESRADTFKRARLAGKHFFRVAAGKTAAGGAVTAPAKAKPSGVDTIVSVGVVLALTVVGDTVAAWLAIPVPGAAIGMLMLASLFAVRGGADPASSRLFDAAAPHIPLFFIPAAVGVIASADLLARAWLPIAVAIVLGTALTLVTTGALAQLLLRGIAKRPSA